MLSWTLLWLYHIMIYIAEEGVSEEVLVGAEITWDRGEAACWRLPSTPMLSPLKWFCVNMSTAEHLNVSLLVKGKVIRVHVLRLRRLCLWTTAFDKNFGWTIVDLNQSLSAYRFQASGVAPCCVSVCMHSTTACWQMWLQMWWLSMCSCQQGSIV